MYSLVCVYAIRLSESGPTALYGGALSYAPVALSPRSPDSPSRPLVHRYKLFAGITRAHITQISPLHVGSRPSRPRDTHRVRVCTLLCGAAVVEVDPTPALEHHLHLLQYVILCVTTADDILPERDELLPPVRSEDQQEAQPLAPVAREPLSESPLSPHLSR